MSQTKPPLYLIDAYGLIYRSYFAFMSKPLRNPAGKNVSALFGFARSVAILLNEGAPSEKGQLQKPLRLVAVFDSLTPTFRHKMYSEYKATRQKAPEDLHEQVPLVEELLKAMGVPALAMDGFEADDIIATLAKQCQKEGRDCYIISSDKDLLQLVGKGTWELRPAKMSNSESGNAAGLSVELVGAAEVKAEWGVNPDKVLDLLSLTGDSSDNVPGVKGVGEVTAVKLMSRYGSLDEIYKNIAGIEGAVGKKLAAGKESAYFSKSLIKLAEEVPLGIKSIDELSVENIDRTAGAQVLLREGIPSVAKMLDKKAQGAAPQAGGAASGTEQAHTGAEAGFSANGGAYSPWEPADEALKGKGVYKTILDLKELEALLAKARKQGLLALDFETDSLDAWNAKPIGISLAIKPKEGFYVPVAPHEGTAPFIEPEKVKALLIPILMDAEMTIAAHNAKYDYKVSRGWGIERWKCKIWDTMVAAWIMDPERNNYSLDSLAGFFFGVTTTAYNDIVAKGSTFDTVALDVACAYSAEDADLCIRVMQHLEPRLKKTNSMDLFAKLEMPLLPILAEMEGIGIKIEPKVLRDYGKELGEELEKIQAETYKTVGHEFNISSPKQLQVVLFEERKLKPGKKTKTGYSTDVAVLEELAHEDKVPALILRHRTLSKLKSTYVDALADLADREGRLHTNFVQTGTATGRLSSREPNLQNIPIREEEGRRIREAFIAKPGCVLVSADYSQIELVVLAHLSGDKNLLEAFTEGKDVHARTAALIFGEKETDVTPDQRRIAKTINFGVMYGMSAFRLANELSISRTDAANFIEAYFKTYSGIRTFIDELVRKTEETGYASTIFGRRRTIAAINSRNKTEKAAAERVAVNTPIQGSAADIVKTAMLNLDKALTKAKSPARLLLQVHDELILECPRDAAKETAELVKREMENAVKLTIPLRVSVETGKHWGDFH
ncbi:DNA polymerase I [Leadbettera azotonutricia]|uniref:DNA polymerase I n=1 Tax=Leadbettera azotonutricia (strain ATCC BAA-888 / DSM 13862 / ZAS-9) TaxID=545695 RepID=F5YDN9_LEAAZ|nr:DNA polymerase I [Leadbettera azotonutricia]AEF80628.1 DNA-directed DNA polymerase [Leadbettera azotonutricia ZAS-9]